MRPAQARVPSAQEDEADAVLSAVRAAAAALRAASDEGIRAAAVVESNRSVLA
jgi:hypothetical protein